MSDTPNEHESRKPKSLEVQLAEATTLDEVKAVLLKVIQSAKKKK